MPAARPVHNSRSETIDRNDESRGAPRHGYTPCIHMLEGGFDSGCATCSAAAQRRAMQRGAGLIIGETHPARPDPRFEAARHDEERRSQRERENLEWDMEQARRNQLWGSGDLDPRPS